MAESHRPVVICLSSGKGGVGKTSLTINLGYALAQRQRRVLIVDGDLGLANVDVMLRLSVRRTIQDILEHGEDPMEAVVEVEPNLSVLPASSGVPELVSLDQQDTTTLGEVIATLAENFDYILLDTAAGIGSAVLWFNMLASLSIVVATPDPTSLTDAYALIKTLAREHGRQRFHILVNQAQDDTEGMQVYDTLAKVARRFLKVEPVYLGTIPADKAMSRAVRDQIPLLKQSPSSKAAQAMTDLADRVNSLARF